MKLLPISQQDDFLKILVYGKPDVGKTTFAASGSDDPVFAPTVVMNMERGLQSVRWGNALMTPYIDSPEGIKEVIIAAASKTGEFADVKTLVVDSLTKMASILLRSIVKNNIKNTPRRKGTDKIELSDYGDLTKAVERYVDMLVGLDMHIIFIALEKEVKEDDVVQEITLALPGGLPNKVIAACDNVWAMRKMPAQAGKPAKGDKPAVIAKPVSVGMLTQQTGKRFARVRNDEFRESLAGGLENPTLPVVWERYQQALAAGRAKLEGPTT